MNFFPYYWENTNLYICFKIQIMNRLLYVLLFSFIAQAQINSGCFDDNYTMQVGLSVWTSGITDCEDGIDYLNEFGYGCNTYLSELNNPFWGSNPNETIANICSCTCEEIVIEILGCLDVDACNYNSEATDDDGSCIYSDIGYNCDGDCLTDLDGDGICDQFEVIGCTDGSACNYDPLATDDDDSCIYPEPGYDCTGECIDFEYLVVDCECSFLDPATYTVFFTNIDEENCLIIEDCYCECINDWDNDGICDENEQVGCTDINACNYDSNVNPDGLDDGSCIYPGDECIAGILEGGDLIYGIYNEDCMCVENNSFIEKGLMPKTIIKVIDLLGRNVKQKGFIIKIYSTGVVEKSYFY